MRATKCSKRCGVAVDLAWQSVVDDTDFLHLYFHGLYLHATGVIPEESCTWLKRYRVVTSRGGSNLRSSILLRRMDTGLL